MGEAIGQALSFAVGVALSPVPIIAVILMLVTPRARANGPAFVLGWLLGLAIVGAIVLLLADPAGANDDGEPATWVGVLEGGARRSWRSCSGSSSGEAVRGRASRPRRPSGWLPIDTFTAPKALGMGALLSGLNPKNLLLAIGAAAAVAQLGIPGGEQAIAYAVFAVIATIGVAAPVVIYFVLGDRAGPILDDLKDLDGAPQRRDHDRADARDRREARRGRDRRSELTPR